MIGADLYHKCARYQTMPGPRLLTRIDDQEAPERLAVIAWPERYMGPVELRSLNGPLGGWQIVVASDSGVKTLMSMSEQATALQPDMLAILEAAGIERPRRGEYEGWQSEEEALEDRMLKNAARATNLRTALQRVAGMTYEPAIRSTAEVALAADDRALKELG